MAHACKTSGKSCRPPERPCHKLHRVIRALLCTVLALQAAPAIAAEPKQVQLQGAHFVGAAGCKSSSCHGGAGEKRSQYITWSRHDVHTRGYAILTNARSERIAAGLKLSQQPDGGNAATTSARCTVCHSPFQSVSSTQRAPTAEPTESVSCESCHGAAGSWLRSHTRPDWTYATRVGAGMRDLQSFYVRANTCVACHQNLDPDIVAAGHPELIFELDGQTTAQPKHWRDPEDSGTRAWLTGQAVALRELSWRLALNPTGDPQALAQWSALVWLLSHVTAADGGLGVIPPDEQPFAQTQQQADALARRAAQQNLTREFRLRVLQRLVSFDREFSPATAHRAKSSSGARSVSCSLSSGSRSRIFQPRSAIRSGRTSPRRSPLSRRLRSRAVCRAAGRVPPESHQRRAVNSLHPRDASV